MRILGGGREFEEFTKSDSAGNASKKERFRSDSQVHC